MVFYIRIIKFNVVRCLNFIGEFNVLVPKFYPNDIILFF